MKFKSNNRKPISPKLFINIFFISIFGTLLFGFIFFNFEKFNQSFSEGWKQEADIQQKFLLIEKNFQEKIYKRVEFINLYGIALNALNLKIVGNFDFVKDSHNLIQRFGTKTDTDIFLRNIEELKEVAAQDKTPLVYITLPDRAKYLEFEQSDHFYIDERISSQIGKQLKNSIDCLDLDNLMSKDMDAPSFEEFYFKTDLHSTTYGEFWTAKMLVNHLQDQYNINFPNVQQVFDLNQYDITEHQFVGNIARSAGEYFIGTDKFEIYRPKYETNLKLINPSSSEEKAGSFEDIMLNGYENDPIKSKNKYTYWITEYGRFTSPYYQYFNENASDDSPNILIISDSAFMRGASYLTLACKKLTVLDPRFFKETEYVSQILSLEHYDSIVLIGFSSHYYEIKFSSRISLPDLPTKKMISPEDYGRWIGNRGICLGTCNGNRLEGRTDMQLESGATNVKLSGWAIDFFNDAPFKELYLQIGNVIVECKYGVDRTDVVEHFGKDSLLKTGFQVEFPVTYLQENPDTEIAFIGVSADGKSLYEPVLYHVISP